MPAKFKVAFFTYHPSALRLLKFFQKVSSIRLVILPATRDAITLSPVILWLRENNISYLKTKNCNEQTVVQRVQKVHPDLMVIFNFPQILKKDLLIISRTINFHPGDLPKYRGAHVLNWALINGEKRIAITCHFVNEQIDAGNIIAKKYIRVNAVDDIGSLSKKVAQAVPILAQVVLKKIANPNFSGQRQNLKKSTYFKRRKPEDGEIDWNQNSQNILNLVRALAQPWPGAFTYLKRKKIIIEKAKIVRTLNLKPGEYQTKDKKIYFGTNDCTLEVIKFRK